MQLLVRFPNWIGDAVMATPILEHFDAVSVVAKPHIQTLLQHHPAITSFYTPEEIPNNQYDCGLLLTNSFSSVWNFWKKGVKRRIGFTGDWRRLLLTDPLPFPKKRYKQHLSLTYQMLLQPLGKEPRKIPPRVFITQQEKEAALQLVGKRPLVGFHMSAAYGAAKCWPKNRFKNVAKMLIREGIHCVFFGASNEADAIAPFVPSGAFMMAGKTSLRMLMASLSVCDVVISNDSGPMHIADALGTPVISLFGSTEPLYTGPFSNMKNVIRKKVACAPCFKKECPIDFRCMNGIEENYVIQKTLALLETLAVL